MNAVDMAQFIAPKSDQLNSDDLIGGPITITVTSVSANEGSPEQPISIGFQGDDRKPYKPCKSMRRVMVAIWGADASKYVGRSMTLYRDPNVLFGGMKVGGIRISHMSGIDEAKTMALTASKAKRAPFTVQPLKVEATTDSHRDWTDKHIAAIKRAPDMEKLDSFVAGRAKLLGDLKEARTELHDECEAALFARRSELAPKTGDDDDPFAEPTDKPDLSGFVTGLESRIAAATTLEQLDEIAEDLNQQSDDLPEDQFGEHDRQIAAARRKIGKGG